MATLNFDLIINHKSKTFSLSQITETYRSKTLTKPLGNNKKVSTVVMACRNNKMKTEKKMHQPLSLVHQVPS